jgi:hypothetical protein
MPVSATTNQYRNLAVIAAALGLLLNAFFAVWAVLTHPALNTDFMAFWSFPRFAAGGDVMGIYDAAKLQAFQQTLYPGFHSFYPYLYPPTLLTVTFWLRDFSFAAAQTIWTVAGLAALTAAGGLFYPKQRRVFGIVAMLGSPAALLTGATGETAFFTTALLLAGFAALPRRPVLAGIAFGLLTLKPQLGVLIPVFLLARGDWRAIGAAAATALALVVLSCVAFPPALWPEWAQTLPAYQADYFAAGGTLNLNIIVTIAANLVTLGAGVKLAWAAQTLSSLGVIIAVFFTARRAPYHLAVAALFTGIFLTAPHAYAYDSIILTAALLLVSESGVSRAFMVIALVIYLGPLMLLTPMSHWFLYAIPEAVLFVFILRLAFAAVRRDSAAHQPVVTRNA